MIIYYFELTGLSNCLTWKASCFLALLNESLAFGIIHARSDRLGHAASLTRPPHRFCCKVVLLLLPTTYTINRIGLKNATLTFNLQAHAPMMTKNINDKQQKVTVTAAAPIPLPTSHIHRTHSELQLAQDQLLADYQDGKMYERIRK